MTLSTVVCYTFSQEVSGLNNEEKILEMLGKINGRLEKFEDRMDNLEEDVTFVRGAVAVIENEHGKKLDAFLMDIRVILSSSASVIHV